MTARPDKPGFRVVMRNWWSTIATGCTERENHILIYLETTNLAHWTGLYTISPKDISRQTSMPIKDVLPTIDGLCGRSKIVWDGDRQLVYVRGFMLRQLGVDVPNQNQVEGLVRIIERMPDDSPAVKAFLQDHRHIPEIDELYETFYPLPPTPLPITSPQPEGGSRCKVLGVRSEVLGERGKGKGDNVIAQKGRATTPASSIPSSTSKTKGNGHGQPASKGNGKDNAIAFLKTVPVSWRTSVENLWKRIEAGESNRPQEREALKRMGWFTEDQISFLIPECGSAGDFLSGAVA